MSAKDVLNVETFVLESTLEICDQIRIKLQHQFDFVWLYVYPKSPKSSSGRITISNAVGGQMDRQQANEIIRHAKIHHDKLKY